jgi:DNA-binding transcriptional regulator YdaS (Cro superfamily)
MRSQGLKAAIEAAGGVRPLARKLGISASAFCEWKRVPAHLILQVEAVTGVAREWLRPDLYRLPPRHLDAADEATVDAIEQQKLAATNPGQL